MYMQCSKSITVSGLNNFKHSLRLSLEQVNREAPVTLVKQRVYIWSGREVEEPRLCTIVAKLCGCNVYVDSINQYLILVGRQKHVKLASDSIQNSITFLHKYSNECSRPKTDKDTELFYLRYRDNLRRKSCKDAVNAAQEVWLRQVLSDEERALLFEELFIEAHTKFMPLYVLKKGVYYIK